MKKAQLINLIVVAVTSAVIGAWSFWHFQSVDPVLASPWEMSGGMVLEQSFEAAESAFLKRNGRDSVVLLPGAKASLSWDEDELHLDIDLESGGVLVAADAGDFSASVNTNFVRMDAEYSTAFFSLNEDEAEIFSLNHANLLTLTEDEIDLNSILVPSNMRMTVPASKVGANTSQLLYTKLTKEFPSFEIEDADLDEIVYDQFDAIETAYSNSESEFVNSIQNKNEFGPATTGFGATLRSFWLGAQDMLTFLPYANERLSASRSEDVLLYAMTNALYGDDTSKQAWTGEWSARSQEKDSILELYHSLFFALPGSELYELKALAASVVFENERPLSYLRQQLYEIEALLDDGEDLRAETSFEIYKANFKSVLNAISDPNLLAELNREYDLLERLLRSHSLFYNLEDLALLTDLEEKILALTDLDANLAEERQAFVQSKLRFLGNLFDFVVERKISADDATMLAESLVTEAEDYLTALSGDVAVHNYFAEELNEFTLAAQFVNSPEFNSYRNFEDGLEEYTAKLDGLEDLNAYIQDIRLGEVDDEETALSLADAIEEVGDDLSSNGIQFSDIVSLEDNSYRLFEIQGARTSGEAFSANYDRISKIMYEIAVSELRFASGVQVANVRNIVSQAANLDEEELIEEFEDEVTTGPASPSLTESVAIARAEEKFAEAGLENFEITLVDLGQNIFSFEGRISEDFIMTMGVYDLDTGRVSNLIWGDDANTFPEIDLAQMENAVLQTNEALKAE